MKTQQVAAIKKSFRPSVKNFVISAEPWPQWKTEKASYSRIQDNNYVIRETRTGICPVTCLASILTWLTCMENQNNFHFSHFQKKNKLIQ